jgi:hypothetical protein
VYIGGGGYPLGWKYRQKATEEIASIAKIAGIAKIEKQNLCDLCV